MSKLTALNWLLLSFLLMIVLSLTPTVATSALHNYGLVQMSQALIADNLAARQQNLTRAASSLKVLSEYLGDEVSPRYTWLTFALQVSQYQLEHQARAYQQAVAFEAQANLEAAIAQYQLATQAGAMRMPAYRALLRLADHDPVARASIARDLQDLTPTFVVSQVVSAANGQAWLLKGYDLDEGALELGQSAILTLYWQRVNQAEVERSCTVVEEDIVCAKYVYQIRSVENVLPNTGFEAPPLKARGVPPGYVLTKDTLAQFVRVAPCDRLGIPTHCLAFDNREGGSSGIQSWDAYEVQPMYLLAAWVKAEQGNGYVSFLSKGKDYDVIHVSGDVAWHHYAGLVTFSEKPAYYRVRVLNYKTSGRLYVDNLLLISIAPPHSG
jgi:hypothetical protein